MKRPLALAGAVAALLIACSSNLYTPQNECIDWVNVINGCPGRTLVAAYSAKICADFVSLFATMGCTAQFDDFVSCAQRNPDSDCATTTSVCAVQANDVSTCSTTYCTDNPTSATCVTLFKDLGALGVSGSSSSSSSSSGTGTGGSASGTSGAGNGGASGSSSSGSSSH